MSLKLGKVSKYKIQRVGQEFYEVRDMKNNSYQLLKRYCYNKKFTPNQFIYLHCFLERDNNLYLSIKIPYLKEGEVGSLKVLNNNKGGLFLDNGFERDVLLPHEEKKGDLKCGDLTLVKIYSETLELQRATMLFSLKKHTNIDVELGSKVDCRVISYIKPSQKLTGIRAITIKEEILVYVNRDDIEGRMPKINEIVSVRLLKYREDGFLNGSFRLPVEQRRGEERDVVLNHLIANNGVITLTDSSSPSDIKSELGISKKAFKKGVGILLSSGVIKLRNDRIILTKQNY